MLESNVNPRLHLQITKVIINKSNREAIYLGSFFGLSFFLIPPSSLLCSFSASLFFVTPLFCCFVSLFLCCFFCPFCFSFYFVFLCFCCFSLFLFLCFFLFMFLFSAVCFLLLLLFSAFPLASLFVCLITSAARTTFSSAPAVQTTRATRKNKNKNKRNKKNNKSNQNNHNGKRGTQLERSCLCVPWGRCALPPMPSSSCFYFVLSCFHFDLVGFSALV